MDCGILQAFLRNRKARRHPHVEDEGRKVPAPSLPHTASGKIDNSTDRLENGRRYHNDADIAYVLPNDDQENDRVHQQHWLMKFTFNGNFCAPVADELDKGILVQDAGCGPGTWTLDMANDFPRSTFIGTDVSSRFPEAIKPGNCNFQIHNLVHGNGFPENHFNYIHQRLLILGLLEKDWEKVIQEHVHTLAPGGWLECMELPVYLAQNPGPTHKILVNAWETMCKAKGLYSEIPDHLEGIFKRAGLVNIERKGATIPISDTTKHGKLAWEDFLELFQALKPVIVIANPDLNGDERYTKFLDDCHNEFIELDTRQIVYRVWGQKPLEIETIAE